MSTMLVKNDWKKPIRIGRDVIKPGQDTPIDEVLLYTPRVQRLRDAKKLIFPFRPCEDEPKEVEEKAEPVAAKPVESDDLTKLVHIGTGRLKVLNQSGIFTFNQVVERAYDIEDLLNISEEEAEEVVEDAKSRS